MNKVILISVDGMRPDGFLNCGNPYIHTLMQESMHCLQSRTVFPSVTLPCHMSMFHSVPPQRHGVLSNTYTPQVRPVSGLFDQAKMAGKTTAMFYGWDQLRDLGRPGSMTYSEFVRCIIMNDVDSVLTRKALDCIAEHHPDFVFLYLVDTDEQCHDTGWMSVEYLHDISNAIDNIKKVVEACGEEYHIIVTADHGGHDRTHGSEMDEDMTIPIFFRAPSTSSHFPAGAIEGVSIMDIPTTAAKLLEVYPAEEWEGNVIGKF